MLWGWEFLVAAASKVGEFQLSGDIVINHQQQADRSSYCLDEVSIAWAGMLLKHNAGALPTVATGNHLQPRQPV